MFIEIDLRLIHRARDGVVRGTNSMGRGRQGTSTMPKEIAISRKQYQEWL
jgi:hypothetical protein